MLCAFDLTMNHVAPERSKVGYTVGLIGFPFNAVLAWPMATQSGYAFFPQARGQREDESHFGYRERQGT